ncbi:hypothetical protein [Prochlorococcus marinus]|uniref:hypothetical protein n=2 Tax=Prochlorococcus TaxID=1218 RepID=UPI0005178D37
MDKFSMKKTFVVYQSEIHSYRLPIWLSFSKKFNLKLFLKNKNLKFLTKEQKLKIIKSKIVHSSGFMNKNILLEIFFNRIDYFWLSIDTKKTLEFIFLQILKFSGTKIIVHSQGLHNIKKHNLFSAKLKYVLHFIWILLANRVIIYSSLKNGPYKINFFQDKIKVVRNRDAYLEQYLDEFLINKSKEKKISLKDKKNILVLGRVRDSLFANFLKEVSISLKKNEIPLKINLVGDINLEQKKLLNSKNLKCFGPIRDPKIIFEIAKDCSIGFHSSDTGLSATSYQMLGLIPVFHSSFCNHGPEPLDSYKDVKCFTFAKNNVDEAVESIKNAYLYYKENRITQKKVFVGKYAQELIENLP